MVVMSYDGHQIVTEKGWMVHEIYRHGQNEVGFVDLTIVAPGNATETTVRLSIDDAQRLATTLLRDVSLARYGSG